MSTETSVPAGSTEAPAAKPAETPVAKVKGGPVKLREDKVHVWPYLTRMELLSAIVAIIVLTVWSITIDAPLEDPANPARTPNPSKAPWYFLGLQELLVYFDPWIAGVVLPTLIIVGLMAIPYIDPNPRGNGYYTFKERWFAVSTFNFGFLILWVSLIMVGVFFRGPGWNLFWPWQYWDVHKVVPLNNVDLNEWVALIPVKLGMGGPIKFLLNPDGKNPIPPAILGTVCIGAWFGVVMHFFGHIVCRLEKLFVQKAAGDQPTPASFYKLMGPIRYYTTGFLFASMLGVVVKIFMRHGLNIKYVLVLPWINANV
ncbi:MAG TPA: cytochrome C [bacterium]|nr:cytochrome C [bacterium]